MNAIADPAPLELKEGEKLAFSITLPDGKTVHTILLPGDTDLDWDAAMALGKDKSADLPDLVELAYFRKYMPDEFRKKAYWSNTQHAGNSLYAWYQDFHYGFQLSSLKSVELGVRLVRRVVTIEPFSNSTIQ